MQPGEKMTKGRPWWWPWRNEERLLSERPIDASKPTDERIARLAYEMGKLKVRYDRRCEVNAELRLKNRSLCQQITELEAQKADLERRLELKELPCTIDFEDGWAKGYARGKAERGD